MSFVDDYVNEEAVDDDGVEIVVKMATKREVATGRQIQVLVPHPDSPALTGASGGLSGSTTVDIDAPVEDGGYGGATSIDLTDQPLVAEWLVTNLAGSATVDLPATEIPFSLALLDIADLSNITIQVGGVDVDDTSGFLTSGASAPVTFTVMPTNDLVGHRLVPVDRMTAVNLHDEDWAGYTGLGIADGAQSTINAAVAAAVANLDTSTAPLESPALTNTPTAPTATAGTSTTQIATTAFAVAEAAGAVTTAEAYSIQRTNHTGTQAAATITGLATVATTGAYSDLTGRPLKVVKPSDTPKTSAPAIAADPHLTLTAPAAGDYIGRAVVLFDSATNADLSINITGPGGSTITGATHGPGVSAAGVPYTVSYLGAAGTTVAAGGVGVGTTVCVVIEFAITTTGSGAVAVQWTQASSQVTATTVKAGSTLRLEAA